MTVLDDQHLAIPDATGNRRLDTLENVVSSGRVALIFLIPGRDTTLRVNGHAAVTAAPEVLDRITPVGKPPRTAIIVRAEEVYTHCPKAFVRSKLWDPATWPDAATLPTSAEVSLAHQRDRADARAGAGAGAGRARQPARVARAPLSRRAPERSSGP